MDAGEMPAQQLLEGVMIMIGGVLLLTPGFVTDAFGFLCLIPMTRQWLAGRLSSRVVQGVVPGGGLGGSAGGSNQSAHHQYQPHPQDVGRQSRRQAGDVIDGDFKRIDDE